MRKTAVRVGVIGCGNSLAGDDAVGLETLEIFREKMAGRNLPGLRVEAIELATAGLDVIDYLVEYDRALIFDAVLSGGRAGDIVHFPAGRLPATEESPFSVHGVNLSDALSLGYEIYPERMPNPLEVVGVNIKKMPEPFSEEVTPAVRGAAEPAARLALDIITEWSREVGNVDA